MHELMTAAQVADDRPAWLKARRDGIGASEIGTILGLDGAYGSPYALWMEKTGRAQPDDAAAKPNVMQFGLYCENYAAWAFEEQRRDLHVTQGGMYADDEHPWMFATFDRLTHQHGPDCRWDAPGQPAAWCTVPPTAPLQLKTKMAFRDWRTDGIPVAYRAQCLWEMRIAQAGTGYLVPLDRNSGELDGIWQLEWDAAAETDIELMLKAGDHFRQLVERDTPPPVDGLTATTEALRRQFCDIDSDRAARVPLHLARWWRSAAAKEARWAKRKKHVENMLRVATGDAGVWVVWDPAANDGQGAELKIASRRAGPRAGYSVDPKERVESVHPSPAWKPYNPAA